MSIEKVRRYDMQTGRLKHEYGESFVANMVDTPEGRYVEYADVTELVEALKMLIRGYVNTLEGGRDRIVMLGGQCDPLDKLEACDANLRIARNELARWQS